MTAEIIPSENWFLIKWLDVKVIGKLSSQSIYSASKIGDLSELRAFQENFLASDEVRLLAVRKVTQEMKEKPSDLWENPEIYGKDLVLLAKSLKVFRIPRNGWSNVWRISDVWRVSEIFQSEDEADPADFLPTMTAFATQPETFTAEVANQCVQAVMKEVLEPEWEARFEPNSYGSRPGRNYLDAVMSVRNFLNAHKQPVYVLLAKVSISSFSKIHEKALLKKINIGGACEEQLKICLKEGVLKGGVFHTDNTASEPILATLLANIALNGLEKYCQDLVKQTGLHNPVFVRYNEQICIMHPKASLISLMQSELPRFFEEIGLELESTQIICHTPDSQADSKQAGLNQDLYDSAIGVSESAYGAYVKVKEGANPYDEDSDLYWIDRILNNRKDGPDYSALLKKQERRCTICKDPLYFDDKIEVFSGGFDLSRTDDKGIGRIGGLQLVHRNCTTHLHAVMKGVS